MLSAVGHNALYIYIADAVHNSRGLDKDSIISDPRITESDLRAAISCVCEEFGLRYPHLNGNGRESLVALLNNIIDTALDMPSAGRAGEPHESPSGQWESRFFQDNLSSRGQKESAVILGPSGNPSYTALRALRKRAGWKPLTTVVTENRWYGSSRIQGHVDTIRERYIAACVAEGLNREQAESKCEREYIAIRQSYRRDLRIVKGNEGDYDYNQPTERYVDLAPQAAQDLVAECEHARSLVKQCMTMHDITKRWKINNNIPVFEVIQKLRNQKIANITEQKRLSPEQAEKMVDETYIAIKYHPDSGRKNVRIFPAALSDIDREMNIKFPNKTPDTSLAPFTWAR